MTTEKIPHAMNVPGDFYVEDGCCTMCDIPRTVAPNLFEIAVDDHHCFVKRQPADEVEIDKMIEAMETGEMQCIRYCGSDRVIQIRIVEVNEGAACDHLPEDLAKRRDELERFATEHRPRDRS